MEFLLQIAVLGAGVYIASVLMKKKQIKTTPAPEIVKQPQDPERLIPVDEREDAGEFGGTLPYSPNIDEPAPKDRSQGGNGRKQPSPVIHEPDPDLHIPPSVTDNLSQKEKVVHDAPAEVVENPLQSMKDMAEQTVQNTNNAIQKQIDKFKKGFGF